MLFSFVSYAWANCVTLTCMVYPIAYSCILIYTIYILYNYFSYWPANWRNAWFLLFHAVSLQSHKLQYRFIYSMNGLPDNPIACCYRPTRSDFTLPTPLSTEIMERIMNCAPNPVKHLSSLLHSNPLLSHLPVQHVSHNPFPISYPLVLNTLSESRTVMRTLASS